MKAKVKSISVFWKNALNIFGTKIYIYIWSIASSIYFARVLGPDGKGLLTVVISIYSVGIQLGNLGLHSSNTYYISKDKNNTKYALGNSIIASSFSFFIAILGLIVCKKIEIFNLNNVLLITSFLMIPLGIFSLMQKNIILAIGQIKQYNILEIIDSGIVFLLVLVSSFFFNVNIEGVVICYFLGSIITVIYSVYIIIKLNYLPTISLEKLKKYMPFGVKAYVSCGMSFLVLKADIFMLNHYMDEYNIGIYSLAVGIGEMVFMVSASVSLILFPHLGTIADTKQRKAFMKKIYKVMGPISAAIIILMFIMAKWIIELMYGIEYYDAILLLRLILPGILCWSLSQYLYSFFSAENSLKSTIVVPCIGFVTNILLNYFLIPEIGTCGAAISSSITYGFCLIGMVIAYKMYGK